MSTSSAIGNVSRSLQALLQGELTNKKVDVTILSPDELAGSLCANLFLYKVQESPLLKNMDWQVSRSAQNQLAPPPLSLNLFYLLTAYTDGDKDKPDGNSTAHEILGDAMRVLYENPIVPNKYLKPDLPAAREKIKVIQVPVDMEELSRIWSTFGKPFRPSVMYEISVVQIDMLQGHERELKKRLVEIGRVDVEAPFVPPTLIGIDPLRGPPGTEITVFGEHLAGWKARVCLAGEQIPETYKLTTDEFKVTLPTQLKKLGAVRPGLYELQVDIENLCRRTFFFEVTAPP